MALKCNYSLADTSLVVRDAYVKISDILFVPKNCVRVDISIYASESDRIDAKNPVINLAHEIYRSQNEIVFDSFFSTDVLNANSILKMGYEFLKLTYADSEDC